MKQRLSLFLILPLMFLGCAHHEEIAIDAEVPTYVPPEVPVATIPDEWAAALEAEEARERESEVASFVVKGLIGAGLSAIFRDKESRREKRWKRSRERKILVKKGYIDEDSPAPSWY